MNTTHTNSHVVWAWLFTVIPGSMLLYLWLGLRWQYDGELVFSAEPVLCSLPYVAHVFYVMFCTLRSRRLTRRYALATVSAYSVIALVYLTGNYGLHPLVSDVIYSDRSIHLLAFVGPTIVHCTGLLRTFRMSAGKTIGRKGIEFLDPNTQGIRVRWIRKLGINLVRFGAFGTSIVYVDYRSLFNFALGEFGHWLGAVSVLHALLLWCPNPRNSLFSLGLFSLRVFCFLALLFAIAGAIEMIPHNLFVASATGLGILVVSFPIWFLIESIELIRQYNVLKATCRPYLLVASLARGIAMALVLNSPYQGLIESSAHKIISVCLSLSDVLRTFA